MAKNDSDNKVFDVSRAGDKAPITGSKPVIVGHKSEIKDPMVKDEEAELKPPSQNIKKIQPIEPIETKDEIAQVPENAKPDVKAVENAENQPNADSKEAAKPDPIPSDIGEKHSSQDSEIQKTNEQSALEDVEAERQIRLSNLINSKKYEVKIKSKSSRSLKKFIPLILLLLLAGAYLLVDAKIVKTDLKLPYEFFKEQTVDETVSVPVDQTVTQEKQPSTPTTEAKTENPTNAVKEVKIVMKKVGDETALKGLMSQSFIDYMNQKLALSDCPSDSAGVVVEKVSTNFASGLVGCEGGYAAYWYLKDGAWQELGTQDSVECTDLKKTGIPSEFIETCIEDFDADPQKTLPNPNGPLTKVN